MRVEDLRRLERAEKMMVIWMCGVSLKDMIPSAVLYSRLQVESASEVVSQGR